MRPPHIKGWALRRSAGVIGAGLLASLGVAVPITTATASPAGASSQTITSTGLTPGSIKHVWLIIEENKSYDETFSGLNKNTYLWTTLPSQGALLTNYYGTGHFSMDNYISLVSGQAPSYDVQDDCSTTAQMVNNNNGIITAGTVGTGTDTDLTSDGSGTHTVAPTTGGAANGNYGQVLPFGGVDATLGDNGCVYPDDVPTLFDQFNAAGISWKGYAQDLGGAQPVGSSTYVTGTTPGVSDTVPGRDDGECAYPGTSTANPVTSPTNLVAPSGDVTSFTGAQPANANNNGDPADQFVAKHFPFGWFSSLTGTSAGTENGISFSSQPALTEPTTPEPDAQGSEPESNCDANHITNLDDPNDGLVHDLNLPSNEVPAFNWITPNNCSDAHDATCQGNNLSGAFDSSGNPIYDPTGLPSYDPEATTPANYTGGLYAADLFLRYYIPLIEQSAAFKDGGLIDITFDEANPPFTIGNSFNNVPVGQETYGGETTAGDSTTYPAPAGQPTFGSPGATAPGADSLFGAYGLLADAAGENLNGVNVDSEPTGPADPEVTNTSGDQLQPGPGGGGFVDQKAAGETTCPNTTLPPAAPSDTCVSPNLGGSPGSTTEPASYNPSSSIITDPKINADDTGRLVSGPGIPNDSFVGTVMNSGPQYLSANASTSSGTAGANNNFAKPWSGSFQLVNDAGQPVTNITATETNASPGGSGTSEITLSAEGATSSVGSTNCPSGDEAATTAGCVTADPLYDATDFTPGGGDTGSVLISPYITPGTVASTYYNHYSWLRTMEDLFLTGATCTNPAGVTLPAGSVCGGLDGLGHLGYAAQSGLAPFGTDVFTDPGGQPPANTPESPLAVGLPIAGVLAVGGYLTLGNRRRRNRLAV